jgi:DNA polymerase-3 subunit delta'
MLVGGVPQTLLLVGPASVGKATLALDLAAGLLCGAPDPSDRPCRACRGCRLVDQGNHADLHRLAPEGPGGQVTIKQVRDLIMEVARLAVEGGARVVVIEAAHRLNEDAQNALLKTLEEPPSGMTVLLAADDEDLLLPTVRSRAARVRLGPVASRDIAALLVEAAGVDPSVAARLARLASGRPGLALAYAAAPEAATIRQELSRALLDLVASSRAKRLTAVRDHVARARELATALAGPATAPLDGAAQPARGRGRRPAAPAVPAPPSEEVEPETGASARGSAAERRRAAQTLIEVWRDTARDLLMVQLGDRSTLREPELLEEYEAASRSVPREALAGFLRQLDRAAGLIDRNAYPELALDVLVLAIPRHGSAAA